MATKKRERFTKWRISDVLEAIVGEPAGKEVCPGERTFTRRAAANAVIRSLRGPTHHDSAEHAIRCWYLYLPWALGIETLDGPNARGDEVRRVAARLVAEARRLRVPMRAR
jgi:hypothetical protein